MRKAKKLASQAEEQRFRIGIREGESWGTGSFDSVAGTYLGWDNASG